MYCHSILYNEFNNFYLQQQRDCKYRNVNLAKKLEKKHICFGLWEKTEKIYQGNGAEQKFIKKCI